MFIYTNFCLERHGFEGERRGEPARQGQHGRVPPHV